ncbi:MAG: PEP-CTERM sorting domain-containing protein [Burkholderiales bacterium]|nr:PEP-CTERM sorting domain-containing protein [Burkholderiales bacterium]
MDFRPILSPLFLASALLLPADGQAASITLSSDDVVDPDEGISGAFEHLHELPFLNQGGSYRFTLRTLTEGSASGDFSIDRVVFLHDSGSLSFDATDDGTQLRWMGASQQAFGSEVDSLGSYEFDPVLLGAGSWSVLVYGRDADNKLWSSYDLVGVPLQNRVPEPAALGLVLLAGLVAARTRRKA